MSRSITDMTGRIAGGDAEAFAAFYRAWFDHVYREARVATGRDESFCLDVVHDTMLRVVKSLPVIEEEAALRRWLRVTVRSCAYDRLRQETRRRRRERAASDRPRDPDQTGDVEQAERIAWLRRALSELDESSATLLTLRHRFGWTLARIGAALGMSTGSVDRHLRRAVTALGTRAREDFDE